MPCALKVKQETSEGQEVWRKLDVEAVQKANLRIVFRLRFYQQLRVFWVYSEMLKPCYVLFKYNNVLL
jgi:hypothetical protein